MKRPHLTYSCAWDLQNTFSHVYEAEILAQEKEMSVFIIAISPMKQRCALTGTLSLSRGAAGHWTTSLARFLALPPVVSTSGPRSAPALLRIHVQNLVGLDYGRASRSQRCVIDRPYRSHPVTHLVAAM